MPTLDRFSCEPEEATRAVFSNQTLSRYLAVGSSRQSLCRSHCCPPPGNWDSSRTCWRCHRTHVAECGPACAHGSPSLSLVHLQYQITPRKRQENVTREKRRKKEKADRILTLTQRQKNKDENADTLQYRKGDDRSWAREIHITKKTT